MVFVKTATVTYNFLKIQVLPRRTTRHSMIQERHSLDNHICCPDPLSTSSNPYKTPIPHPKRAMPLLETHPLSLLKVCPDQNEFLACWQTACTACVTGALAVLLGMIFGERERNAQTQTHTNTCLCLGIKFSPPGIDNRLMGHFLCVYYL